MDAVFRRDQGGGSGEGDSSSGDSSCEEVRSSLEDGVGVGIRALLVRAIVPIQKQDERSLEQYKLAHIEFKKIQQSFPL